MRRLPLPRALRIPGTNCCSGCRVSGRQMVVVSGDELLIFFPLCRPNTGLRFRHKLGACRHCQAPCIVIQSWPCLALFLINDHLKPSKNFQARIEPIKTKMGNGIALNSDCFSLCCRYRITSYNVCYTKLLRLFNLEMWKRL